MERNKEGAAIPDIRVKEEFKPKDKRIAPKEKEKQVRAKAGALSKEAKLLMLRQLADASKINEEADLSMQTVNHAADDAAAQIHNVAEKGRKAFQRQARKRQAARA